MKDRLPDSEARVLAALIRVHARDGRAPIRKIAEEAGRSVSVTHKCLVRLADLGLVAGVHEGTHGAIRPMVVPIAI